MAKTSRVKLVTLSTKNYHDLEYCLALMHMKDKSAVKKQTSDKPICILNKVFFLYKEVQNMHRNVMNCPAKDENLSPCGPQKGTTTSTVRDNS